MGWSVEEKMTVVGVQIGGIGKVHRLVSYLLITQSSILLSIFGGDSSHGKMYL